MNKQPDKLTRLAFNLKEGAPLTTQQQAICEEWETGQGAQFMKIEANYPGLFEMLGLYNKLEQEKAAIWQEIISDKRFPGVGKTQDNNQ